ncbi:MAG: hypothetical protein AMXMBFR83_31110 [Phycisphaerae bacterium]
MSRTFSWIRRPVEPIGLDLGTRYVRMMQVCRHQSQTTVTACAQHEIPPGTHAPAELADVYVRAVKTMLAGGRFLGREVVSALSWDQLAVRNVRIPPMPEEDVAEAVRFEAADRMGLGPDQGEVRFLIAGDVRQGTEIRQEVIVLAVEHAVLNAHLALLGRMGLQPAGIDASPCAMFRGFERFLRRGEDSNDANVFIDIGYSGTRVLMSRGPEITFLKAIPIGGRRFDELVSESMSVAPHEAVQLRRRLNRPTGGEVRQQAIASEGSGDESVRRAVLDALRPALEQLAKEIALCIRYGAVTFRGPRADTVTAVGGEACCQEVLQVLSDQVGIPFHLGKPLRGIGIEAEIQGLDRRNGQPEWATALGLALKSGAAVAPPVESKAPPAEVGVGA